MKVSRIWLLHAMKSERCVGDTVMSETYIPCVFDDRLDQ